jgi:hypothetical protein
LPGLGRVGSAVREKLACGLVAVHGNHDCVRTKLVTNHGQFEVANQIRNYSVALFAVRNKPIEQELAGSGTLVKIDDAHYILTAQHVWDYMQRFDGLVVTLHADRHETVNSIGKHLFQPTTVVALTPELGPDICFLRIPISSVGGIAAVKSFYNLSTRKSEALSSKVDEAAGPWMLSGVPAKLGSFSPQHANFQHTGIFFPAVSRVFEVGDDDYVEVLKDNSTSILPASLGGMSGGGLWQLFEGESKELRAVLEGVAFYQLDVSQTGRLIRCHGRRTIYRRMPCP